MSSNPDLDTRLSAADRPAALTRTFRIAGTPLDLAPKQARGERRNPTARTDGFALGAMRVRALAVSPDGWPAREAGTPKP